MKKLSGMSKGFVIVLIVLLVALTGLTIMERVGYPLMYTHITMVGSGVLLLVLLVWGAVAIFRRLKTRLTRILLGIVAGFIVMFALTLIMTIAQMSSLQPFNTITLPSGERVVVLYTLDTGFVDEAEMLAAEARMDARVDAMVAEGVLELAEGTQPVDYPSESYGYLYTAYPRVMGFFVDAKARSEGFLYMGVASEAEIKYVYSEADNTVRFYIENAEPGDEGEIVLYME